MVNATMARGVAKDPSVNPPVKAATPADSLVHAVERVLTTSVTDIVGRHVCVGLSGGIDSVVLLDVLIMLAPRYQWRLSAIHVNHQLSPNAPAWAAFCRRACRARGVPLHVVKVQVARGNSTEASARDARYAAYRACRADVIALAHHQDDQVETLLLRLLRGAGVKGLAGMPFSRDEGGLSVVRPLLDVPRHDIERYAKRRALQWVEDESNTDTHYLRNFLRADILPHIALRVPGYRETLTRAAGHLAEAAELLDELAASDALDFMHDEVLEMEGLRRLSAARAKNLLRYFLARTGMALPDKRLLDEALRQALHARLDARVKLALDGHALYRYNGALHLVRAQSDPGENFRLSWQGERTLRVPALAATLTMARGSGTGIDAERLRAAPVTLRLRQGGERLRPDAARPRRRVKDLFQEQDVPPWMRDRVPFLWSGRHLVWVPGLGVDQRFHARPGAPSLLPIWRRDGEALLRKAGKAGKA